MFEGLLAAAKRDRDILAVLTFGSFARGEPYKDIDICLVLARPLPKLAMSQKRLFYLTEFPHLDIQLFQQLPLYIRVRVLREGKIIFCRNVPALYDIAIATAKAFEDFRPIYESYLEGVAHA